jgi:hypothetical protein
MTSVHPPSGRPAGDPPPSADPASPNFQLPPQVLAGVQVKPGDEKLLETAWGKWMAHMHGAPSDPQELIRMIKASMQQYFNDIKTAMQQEQERYEKVAEQLKRVAEGGNFDE